MSGAVPAYRIWLSLAALRTHRDRQKFERLAVGAAWVVDGWNLVFTRRNGRPLHSTYMTKLF